MGINWAKEEARVQAALQHRHGLAGDHIVCIARDGDWELSIDCERAEALREAHRIIEAEKTLWEETS